VPGDLISKLCLISLSVLLQQSTAQLIIVTNAPLLLSLFRIVSLTSFR
jgi:predicted ATPase